MVKGRRRPPPGPAPALSHGDDVLPRGLPLGGFLASPLLGGLFHSLEFGMCRIGLEFR